MAPTDHGPSGAGGFLDSTFVSGGAGWRIDALLTRWADYGFSGVVLVYSRGLVLLHKGYGMADREIRLYNTPENRFPLAALSRLFHTAGIVKLEEEEGRAVCEKTFGDIPSRNVYLRDRLFRPAGMSHTCILGDAGCGDYLIARNYAGTEGSSKRILGSTWLHPALGLFGSRLRRTSQALVPVAPGSMGQPADSTLGFTTTTGDLFRWELALRGDRILSEVSRRRLFSLLSGQSGEGRGVLAVRGSGPGHEISFLRDPEADLTVIVAANNDMGWCPAVQEKIEEIMRRKSSPLSTLFLVCLTLLATLLLLASATVRAHTRSRRRRPGEPFLL